MIAILAQILTPIICANAMGALMSCSTPRPSATPTPIAIATPAPTPTPQAFAPAGTQPFPSGPFNVPVSAPKVDPQGDPLVTRVIADAHTLGKLQFSTNTSGPTDGLVPIYVAHASDPEYVIHCRYYSACPLEGAHVHIPAAARPEGNLGFTSFTDTGSDDQHIAVRDVDAHVEADLWLSPQPSGTGGPLDIGYGGLFAFDSGGYNHGGATAAGFALTQGRVRAVDLLAGHIPYALFMVTPCENGHVAPAVGDDGGKDVGCPPIGARLWLDSSDADVASSGASPDGQTIMRALHEYGGYIGDRCSSCALTPALEGGLSYTALGLANPWAAIAAHYPSEAPSGARGEYHILINTGSLDLTQHLHVIAYP